LATDYLEPAGLRQIEYAACSCRRHSLNGDAISFFRRLCEISLQEDIEKADAGAVHVAPGCLRVAIEEQWRKLEPENTSRYKQAPLISQ
jgi:hypothetical protein